MRLGARTQGTGVVDYRVEAAGSLSGLSQCLSVRRQLFKNGVAWLLGTLAPTATDALAEVPADYTVSAFYPNPFVQQARFSITLSAGQTVRIAAYDVLGRRVAVLHKGWLGAQEHGFTFVPSGLPSGLYLIRVEGEHFRATRQAVLAR